MTIPTRPAPAPPQMRHVNGSAAAADANASLEQLRLQLQQQQQQQKITIKLPPPPKGCVVNNTSSSFPLKSHFNNSNNTSNTNNNFDSGSSSITRKFPKARYAPTTNWDDSPFEISHNALNCNGNVSKKVPPPRPPPPKVLVNGRTNPPTAQQTSASTNILTNIFHRKKTTTTAVSNSSNNKLAKQKSAARVYGVSSGNYGTTSSTYEAAFSNSDWNAAWNTTSSSNIHNVNGIGSLSVNATSQNQQDAQLISFDSPPSSPTFTQKSNSDCVSVDSFSSDSNFSSPQNGSVSQPESGFEDDFSAAGSHSRSRPATTSPLDPWETFDNGIGTTSANCGFGLTDNIYCSTATIGTAPVRNLNTLNMRTVSNATSSQDNPLCNGKSLLPPAPSMNMPTIIKPKISQKPKAPKPPTVFGLMQKHQQIQEHQKYAAALDTDLPTPPSPPMPQGAPPPPPPSILDVISGKVDALQLAGAAGYDNASANSDSQPYGIALYDFEGTEEGDLCFREGEKIYLLEQASDDWYRGRTRSGCEGLLPANYIDVKVPLQIVTNMRASSNSQNVLPKIRCLYDFPAEIEGDLALKENDMVTILHRINEDWLFGEINNRQGQFPANFLEYIPNNIPLP